MRTRVVFQTPVETPDGKGGVATTWGGDVGLWVAFEKAKGVEDEQGMRIAGRVLHYMTGQYDARLVNQVKLRIVIGSRLMNVKSVVDVAERHKFLEVQAVEGEPA